MIVVSHISRGPPPNSVYQPPRNTVTVLASASKPVLTWNGSHGLASSFSAKANALLSGLPCEPMYVSPGTEPPCRFCESRSVGASDRHVGVVVGPERADAAFMPISSRIGPLTIAPPANDVVELERAVTPLAAIARITGRYSGLRAGHHRVDGDLLDRELPELAIGRSDAGLPDDLVGVVARAGEHRLDALLGGQHDRAGNPSSGSRRTAAAGSPRCRAEAVRGVERSKLRPARSSSLERRGQAVDQRLHERDAVDRIRALDVVAQRLGRAPTTGCGTNACRSVGMPSTRATELTEAREHVVCTATVGTPSASSASASPTTVGLQVLQSPRRGSPHRRRPRSGRASRDRRPSSRAAR